mgnify:CR=1 FL=1
MRYWTTSFPDRNSLGEDYMQWVTLSEKEIIEYWRNLVDLFYYDAGDLTDEQCVADWCNVNYAERNYWWERMENAQ